MMFKRYCYEFLSFIRHLPDYYRLHIRNTAKQYMPKFRGDAIFVNRDAYILAPLTSSVAYYTFMYHSAWHEGACENKIFLKLREGCNSFLDLGAEAGFYSALFAATATEASRIVAVDMAPAMCQVHQDTITQNINLSGKPIDWTVHQVALSDKESNTTLSKGFASSFVNWYDTDPNRPVRFLSLNQFLQEVSFIPDLIKLDIESFEYEVITSSMNWLVEHKPRLHLELHSQLMRDRGKSPNELMSQLLEHYRIVDSIPRNYQSDEISRIGLVPK